MVDSSKSRGFYSSHRRGFPRKNRVLSLAFSHLLSIVHCCQFGWINWLIVLVLILWVVDTLPGTQ
ncbi:hypothetical protein LINPERPRIM_LOCUS34281 [Linum perenne]